MACAAPLWSHLLPGPTVPPVLLSPPLRNASSHPRTAWYDSAAAAAGCGTSRPGHIFAPALPAFQTGQMCLMVHFQHLEPAQSAPTHLHIRTGLPVNFHHTFHPGGFVQCRLICCHWGFAAECSSLLQAPELKDLSPFTNWTL